MTWRIRKQKSPGIFVKFYLLAEQRAGEDVYSLECSWAQCMYILSVTKNGAKDWIYSLSMFTDDDPEKITAAILAATEVDIEERFRMLEELNLDGELGYVDNAKIERITSRAKEPAS